MRDHSLLVSRTADESVAIPPVMECWVRLDDRTESIAIEPPAAAARVDLAVAVVADTDTIVHVAMNLARSVDSLQLSLTSSSSHC